MRVVGMAAPQVGINARAFYAFGELFLNPKFIPKTKEEITVVEGCCSLPDMEVADVKRYNKVECQWFTPQRQFRAWNFEGSQAAVIQHEIDHLNGVLISDRAVMRKLPSKDKTRVEA